MAETEQEFLARIYQYLGNCCDSGDGFESRLNTASYLTKDVENVPTVAKSEQQLGIHEKGRKKPKNWLFLFGVS